MRPAPSDQFYQRLGPAGLAGIAPDFTAADARWLSRLLRGRPAILDAGCGYGRVAIPLAEAGHRVLAVDLDPGLVADGRRRVRGRRLPLRFMVGDVRRLPAPAGRFDAVLCLWSTFQHLHTARDRNGALADFHRVLRPGGLLILEMTDAGEPGLAAALARRGRGPRRRLAEWTIHGATIRCYLHDAASLGAALATSPFARHRVTTRQVRGIRRLVGLAWSAAG
jgi:SAM-dependent methyltransferase